MTGIVGYNAIPWLRDTGDYLNGWEDDERTFLYGVPRGRGNPVFVASTSTVALDYLDTGC